MKKIGLVPAAGGATHFPRLVTDYELRAFFLYKEYKCAYN